MPKDISPPPSQTTPLPQPQRPQDPLPRHSPRDFPTPLHRQRPDERIHRMRQHGLLPGSRQVLALLRFPPNHLVDAVRLGQLRETRGREDGVFCEGGQGFETGERRVGGRVSVCAARDRGAQEGEGGLQREDAFS